MSDTTHALKKIYVAGSQMWFEKKHGREKKLRGYGCGVVALHDFITYKGYLKKPEGQNEFKERIRKIERGGMYVFPNLGIAPYFYTLESNLYLMSHRLPVRLRMGWGIRREFKNRAEDIKKCIDSDIPVIFAVGPTFPFLFKKKNIPLYDMNRKLSGMKTKGHYMTVLGVLDTGSEIWLEVASWGNQYSIRLSDMAAFSKYTFPFTTRFYRAVIRK